MAKPKKTEQNHIDAARDSLLDAALNHVVFDGWSQPAFDAALVDSKVDAGLATQACPRGAVDLAVAFHRRGDAQMLAAMATADLGAMRYRDRVAFGVRARLEAAIPHREEVRRGAALFALPNHAPEGSALIWGTADAIWKALGDSSQDVNWYTKRATLSAVYSATLLFWLGDTSEDFADTWAFLDRRIENVMQIEKVKGKLKESPFIKGFFAGPGRIFDHITAPNPNSRDDLPGFIADKS